MGDGCAVRTQGLVDGFSSPRRGSGAARAVYGDSMRRWFNLESYSRVVREDPDEDWRYRLLMHQLPRQFHALSQDEQAAALLEPPTRTGRRCWDAFLAAVVEHVAVLHGHAVPAWLDEPERFQEPPWVIARTGAIAVDSRRYAPPAFQRHGALPDPLDLDPRGGELHEWIPGSWAGWTVEQRPCPWCPDWRPATEAEIAASLDRRDAVTP